MEMIQNRFEREPLRKRLLPSNYLENGYFIKGTIIYDSLLISDPIDIVKALTDNDRGLEDKPMEYNQFRIFYDLERQIERKLKWGESWEKARQEILQLVSLANKSCERRLAPHVFLQFMRINVDKTTNFNSPEAFIKGLLVHMECINGFWPKDNKSKI
jgi:hypothetical protein